MPRVSMSCSERAGVKAAQIACALCPVGDDDAVGERKGRLGGAGGDTGGLMAVVALYWREESPRRFGSLAFAYDDIGVELIFAGVIVRFAGDDAGLATCTAVEVDDHGPLWRACRRGVPGEERRGESDSHGSLKKTPALGVFREIAVPLGVFALVVLIECHSGCGESGWPASLVVDNRCGSFSAVQGRGEADCFEKRFSTVARQAYFAQSWLSVQ